MRGPPRRSRARTWHGGCPRRLPRSCSCLSGRQPFLLGTDAFGRDIFSRIIFGTRISLIVGVVAVAVAIGAGVGIPTGLIAGYFGGRADAVIMHTWDALRASPGILMGIAVVTVLGPGAFNAAPALAIISIPQFSRLTRARVLGERAREYVQAARCSGSGDIRLLVRHLLPNCLGPILVQLSLGMGAQPPKPSWGGMLNGSCAYLRQAPRYGVWPGVALAGPLVRLNYLSDALREALDPCRINAA